MSFQPKWLLEFPWLRYDETASRAFCTTCQLANGGKTLFNGNGYAGGKRQKFTRDQIADHAASKAHCTSVELCAKQSAMRLALARAAALEKERAARNVQLAQDRCTKSWPPYAMRCAYFLAHNALAYTLMGPRSFLVQDSIKMYNGEACFDVAHGDYASYATRSTAEEMTTSCAKTIVAQTVRSIVAAKVFSVMLDESTDVGSSHNLAVLARIVVDGSVVVRVLGVVALTGGDADSVYAALASLLAGLDLKSAVLVGFGSDGASVMLGKNNGVATKVVRDHPLAIQSHCPAHRLDLAFSDAESGVEEELLGVLRSVYGYFNRSHPRQAQLHAWITTLGCPRRGLVHGSHTRWLSVGTSIDNMRVIFDAVAHVLRDDEGATASTLYSNYFMHAWFEYWLAYMSDAIGTVNLLSKALQDRNLSIIAVLPMIETTLASFHGSFAATWTTPPSTPCLRGYVDKIGGMDALSVIDKLDWVHETCYSFVQRLTDGLYDRFPLDTKDVVSALACLYPSYMIHHGSCGLPLFGLDAIELLGKKYASLVNVTALASEYSSYKIYVTSNYPRAEVCDLLSLLLVDKVACSTYPSILILLQVALTLVPGSVDCERLFSLQNLIKNDHRNSLGEDHLNDLIICAHDGVDFNAFDHFAQLEDWLGTKKRKRY